MCGVTYWYCTITVWSFANVKKLLDIAWNGEKIDQKFSLKLLTNIFTLGVFPYCWLLLESKNLWSRVPDYGVPKNNFTNFLLVPLEVYLKPHATQSRFLSNLLFFGTPYGAPIRHFSFIIYQVCLKASFPMLINNSIFVGYTQPSQFNPVKNIKQIKYLISWQPKICQVFLLAQLKFETQTNLWWWCLSLAGVWSMDRGRAEQNVEGEKKPSAKKLLSSC